MIYCITGTMKASKSAYLIDFTKKLEDKRYKIFYPSSCNKTEGYVYTRDGDRKIKAIKIFQVKDLYNHIENLDCILIDEFTFICNSNEVDDFMNFLEYADKKGIDIYLFGLSLDYLSCAFDVAQRVLPFCDKVINLVAKCDVCGSEANRCVRYINGELDVSPESDLIVMEGSNVEYKSVCKKCYREITNLSAIK